MQYTGRLDIKHMVQARVLNHDHVDSHYAAAVFRNLRELAIKLRPHCTLVCTDDKHGVKVGEPHYPVAAVDRGWSVLVGKNTVFAVSDHDFTKCKITPSVALVVDVPESIDQSFYSGKVVVTLKDAIFEPSSPLRHADELVKVLKAEHR